MARSCHFHSILVPLDGSRLAEQALPTAIALAERTKAKVRFALVHPEHYPPLLIEPARVYLKQLTLRFRGQLGRSLSSIVLVGPVAPSLARHAREIGADLVVMTTHGRSGVSRAWLGSVTDQLIRMLEVPVLVVRAPDPDAEANPMSFSRILVPLDGSALAETVLEPAAALAQLCQATIGLVQVVQPVFLAAEPALPYPAAYDDELTALERNAAEEYLRRVGHRLQNVGVDTSEAAVLGSGPTAESILELARPDQVGLVALATHGWGGLRRLMLGSVADKLVRSAAVPVLVVPPTRRARQRRSVARQKVAAVNPGLGMAYA
jgi:nucleotide-binding universal stress UspA family protein